MKNTILKISKKILIFDILFILFAFLGSDAEMIIPNLIMGLAFFITSVAIYDFKESVFSLKNLFVLVFLYVGIFMRYLFILYYPEYFQDFAPYKISDSAEFHLLASLAILLFVMVFALSLRFPIVNIWENTSVKNWVLLNNKQIILYSFTLALIYAYKFNNLRYATELNYGTYDNLINAIMGMIQILAYSFLVIYIDYKKKKYIILYLMYLLPVLLLYSINMWKSGFFFEIIVILMALGFKGKKISKKWFVVIFLTLVTVYPFVTIRRDNILLNNNNRITVQEIINYNLNNNIMIKYSNRFQYYDETYYCINASVSDIENFQSAAGSISERFFAGLIPRALWPEKPVVNVGKYITYNFLHYPSNVYNNLSVGFISDAYLSGSYLGVIFYTIFIAILVSYVMAIKKNKSNYLLVGLYLVSSRTIFSYMEGDIAAKSISIVQIFVGMLIIQFLLRIKIRVTSKS